MITLCANLVTRWVNDKERREVILLVQSLSEGLLQYSMLQQAVKRSGFTVCDISMKIP